ncbi:MAG: lipoyl(octanoyl) transferase LipB [Actinobacteria bacterium]|nr:lipoyl(octanoyl) transferase LipB [Actinomycetota bacterium]
MRPAALLQPGVVPYVQAYEAMHSLAELRARDEIPDTLVLLEHPPTYTAGRRSDPAHLLMAEHQIERAGAELHFVDRGGSVTFHGPGQLVGYPIVHLGHAPDVIAHLRRIEEVAIRAAADVGVELHRDPEHTGVWAGARKICAIGVRVQRGVTLHGFAINCDIDLGWFDAIVPCGLEDRTVGSLSALAGRDVTVAEISPLVADRFGEIFARSLSPAPAEVAGAWAGALATTAQTA